ncbi:hypothetical protein FB45DRAFT_46185 [Roridomyces roridus]|uniref:Uncharacterized protein n=1 Tax=Roridomyces roridus TaxID=1738132 RepID=A0AAD7BRZ7_9AGAR|nr:hypothetical protein FB45DRAFT_46185 [Roridomyces roridus]
MTDRDDKDKESRAGDHDRQHHHHSDSERAAHTGDEDAKSTKEHRLSRRDSYHSTSSHRSSSSKKSKTRSKATVDDDQPDMGGVGGAEQEVDRKQKERDETAYGPEFLRALAIAPSVDEDSPFDVIAGADAVEFARRFVQEQEQIPPHATSSSDSHAHTPGTITSTPEGGTRKHLPPVVFALPRTAAGDAGRKVVDFYMSWRGKTKTHRLKGQERRTGFLDSEFKRVKETLDGEWKRASRAIKGGFGGREDDEDELQGYPTLARAPTDPQKPPSLPPNLVAHAQDEQATSASRTPPPATQRTVSDPLPPPSSFPINMERPQLGVHRGSVDSLTSVMSIPLLGLVRGVPVGNRVPLRVMNPGDRFSMSSAGDLDVAETPKARLSRHSPLRDGVAFDVPDDGAETHLVALPGRAGSDSSASSGGSRRSKHRRRKDKGRTSAEEEERGKEKILIVLLDEKDKDKETETEKTPVKEEGSTWHGLEHRLSMRSAQKPPPPTATHVSPWMGPLAHTDEDVTFITTPDPSDSDGSSSEDGADVNWGRRSGAPMPIKNLLSAMGYLAPEARATPSPYGSYTALPMPTPYNSPYNAAAAAVYTSPYVTPMQASPYVTPMQASPYHSPYGMHPQIHGQGSPSRPQTPPIYAPSNTPPQQSTPPWPSYTPAMSATAAVYPSPAQSGYASPYGSAPPSIYGPAPPPLYKPAPASPARPPLYYYG